MKQKQTYCEHQHWHFAIQRDSIRAQFWVVLHEKMNAVLNETCRIVTVCLKAMPLYKLYEFSNIVPLHMRRNQQIKRKKITNAIHYITLYGTSRRKIKVLDQVFLKRIKTLEKFVKVLKTESLNNSERY